MRKDDRKRKATTPKDDRKRMAEELARDNKNEELEVVAYSSSSRVRTGKGSTQKK